MTTDTAASTLGDFSNEELVTGEAVSLDLPAAGLGSRIGGAILDVMVSYTVFSLLLWAVGLSMFTVADPALGAAMVLVAMVAALVGYPVAMESLTHGKTLGKLAAGTRTVRDDGGAIGFRHALTRGLVGFVEIYAFGGSPAVLAALINPRGKRLGDLAAGTYVVRERRGLRLSPPARMPHFLAGWATSADIAPLPDSLALATRQFVSRAHTLSPEARRALGEDLYVELLRHVSPAPPEGVHPEYVMAAILTERGRRDALLIRQRDQRVAALVPRDELSVPTAWSPPPQQPYRADGTWSPQHTFRDYSG